MGKKFDALSAEEKAAVIWKAAANLDTLSGKKGAKARQNPRAYLAECQESLAAYRQALPHIVDAHKRTLAAQPKQ